MSWKEFPQSGTKVIKILAIPCSRTTFCAWKWQTVRDFGFLPSRFISRLLPFQTCQTSYRQFARRIVWLFPVLPAVLWDAKPILAPRKHSDIDNRVVCKPIWNVMPLTVARHSNDIICTQTNANRTNRRIGLKSSQAGEDELRL